MGNLVQLQRRGVVAFILVSALACGSQPAPDDESFVQGVDAPAASTPGRPPRITNTELVVVDEADAPCTQRNASTWPVDVADPRLLYTGLEKVGTRWLTSGVGDEGLVTLDAQGTSALETPLALGELNRAAAVGNGVILATAANRSISAGRFDPTGRAVRPAKQLAEDRAYYLAVGGSAERGLVAWSTGTDVRARTVNADGVPVGEVFALEKASAQSSWTASIAPATEGELAIAWADRRHQGEWGLYFAFVKDGGVSGIARKLGSRPTPISVVKLVKTPTGFALLLQFGTGSDRGDVVVQPLDVNGAMNGNARHLLGSDRAYDLAAHEAELGVVARASDGSTVFRPLDAEGAPVGPWTCFGDADPSGDHAASIATDRDGYMILHRTPDGSTKLTGVNRLGAKL